MVSRIPPSSDSQEPASYEDGLADSEDRWHVLTAISGSCYIEIIERLRARSESQLQYLPMVNVDRLEKLLVGRFQSPDL